MKALCEVKYQTTYITCGEDGRGPFIKHPDREFDTIEEARARLAEMDRRERHFGFEDWKIEPQYHVLKANVSDPPEHAYWIGIGYDGYADGYPVYDEWECSHCGHEISTEDPPPYCSACGSIMDAKPEVDNDGFIVQGV